MSNNLPKISKHSISQPDLFKENNAYKQMQETKHKQELKAVFKHDWIVGIITTLVCGTLSSLIIYFLTKYLG